MRAFVLLTLLVGVSFASNVCRDTAACCQIFDFQRPSTWNASAYTVDTVAVLAGPTGPWAAQGLEISVEQIDSLTGLPYAAGLVNVSRLTAVATGSDRIYSATESLVLSAFEYFATKLLRYSSTIDLALMTQPACLASIRTLRSIDFNYRESVRVTTYRRDTISGDLLMIDQQSALWTVSGGSTQNDFEFSSLHVDNVRVEAYGQGYFGVARAEVCFSAPQGLDSCGVCGGNGAGCEFPGAPCNTHMSGACASGTLNETLYCVPNRANTPEICDGIDQNCDSIIDNGNWSIITCGVGECQRSYSTCINGSPNSRCVPGTPTPEVCDGRDNNCEGHIDEGGVCASASPAPSVSPTMTMTPPPTASAPPTATPTQAPREGIALLLPLATCVRDTDAPGVLQAVFGYAYTGVTVDMSIAPGTPLNMFVSPLGTANQPQPALFHAHTTFVHAFEVLFSSGDQLQWHLNGSVAAADANTRRCDSDRWAALEPVQPHLYQCVSRVADRCTARFGYTNPNPQTVQLNDVSANAFSPAPADRRQPRLFYPNAWVSYVFTTEFDCSAAGWSMTWALTTGTETRTATADQKSLC